MKDQFPGKPPIEELKGKSPEEIAAIAEEIARANSEPEYTVWSLAKRQIIVLVVLWVLALLVLLLVPFFVK
ncbi:MAG TPA: hypothetical protein PKX93_07890 [bacterium]|nr:hypothetical protein [bacterium]HOL67359.1 hypothetical protein [bacterium]